MKKIGTICLVALIGTLTLSSCVENSEKYKNVVAQLNDAKIENDSLKNKNVDLQKSYDEVLTIINKVEEAFAKIREQEKILQIEVNESDKNNISSLSEGISEKINIIEDLLQKNRKHISSLQKELKRMGLENSALAENIVSYKNQLKEKVDMIASLQKTIEEKNLSIANLNQSVDNLQRMSEELQDSIDRQTEIMNQVFYIVATNKELKENKIIRSSTNKNLMAEDFNQDAFKVGDKREIRIVKTGSRNIKVLTAHPEGSYTLETDEDGNMFLSISDADEFWSVSKYLVIKMK